jgi:cysteine-rich repeat protein
MCRPPSENRRRRSILLLSLFVFLDCTLPGRAVAHGEPASLAEWGGFGRLIASCQRAIGKAGFLCGVGTWQARRTCLDADLRGEPCDEEAADEAAGEARSRGIRLVQSSCSFQQLQNLRFIDLSEAQLDVIRFCTQLDTGLVSAVYGYGDTAGMANAETEISCRLSAAHAANKLIHFAFHARLGAMDRIAASPLLLAAKMDVVDHSTAELERARSELAEQLGTECTDSSFTDLYDRSIDAFLATIASRADCLIGATYAQAAVQCPEPICGNGMQEPGEQCDDGNDVETDACTTACRRTGS